MRSLLWKAAPFLAASLLALALVGVHAQEGELPAIPVIYSGKVTVAGQPAPDGLKIFARVLDYKSDPVQTANGLYQVLQIAVSGAAYQGRQITFYATYGSDEVQAQQTRVFIRGGSLVSGRHLGASNSAALTDTTVNFVTRGVAVGQKLYNYTDGASCYIMSVTANTLGCTLTGGTRNTWNLSDQYNVDANTVWLDLTFPRLPAPPPTPTPTPTRMLTPTATLTPTPTPMLPIPGDPSVRSVALWAVAVGALGLALGVVVLRLTGARR